MLTLKEPLKLNIDAGLTTVSEDMYERISGNYGIMSSHITPKELLFYMSAPPELPDDFGGITTIGIQNSISDNRAITMDVVNNVINRILISSTNAFTYQDEVYIESVLHKLGITNISLFMKQIQKLTDEHVSVRQLISLYNQELKLQRQSALPEEAQAATGDTDGAVHAGSPSNVSPYFLHDRIYKRLETQEIYNIVNSFQQEQTHYFGTYHKNQLKTAEQLYVSNMLQLTELRQQVLGDRTLIMKHSANHFELGDLTEAPKNEENVLSQAAAASLISTFEHVLVHQLQQRGVPASGWLSLESVLSETIENTIARFQSYHSGDAIYMNRGMDLSLEITSLHHDETEVLEELISMRTQLAAIGSNAHSSLEMSEISPLLLYQLLQNSSTEHTFEDNTFLEETKKLSIQNSSEINQKLISRIEGSSIYDIIAPIAGVPSEEPEPDKRISLEHPYLADKDIPLDFKAAESGENASQLPSSEITRLTQQFLSQEISGESKPASASFQTSPSTFEAPKTIEEIELEYNVHADSELLKEIVYRQESPSTVQEEEHPPKDFAPVPASEELRTMWEKTVLPTAPQGDMQHEIIAETHNPRFGDSLVPELSYDKPMTLEHPSLPGDKIPLDFEAAEPAERVLQLPSSEITRLTQQFLSQEISNESKTTSVSEQIFPTAYEAFKTVREIELEYDVRAGSELLREIVQRQEFPGSVQEAEHPQKDFSPVPVSETLRTMWEKTILFAAPHAKIQYEISTENFKPKFGDILIPELSYGAPIKAGSDEYEPIDKSHPLTDDEAPPELIAQELAEINQRNRELFQSMQGLRAEKIAESIPIPDAPKTMSDALRALEHPEAVLKELLSAPVATEHPQLPINPTASAYLENADPVSRKVVEAVMRYERDPQSAITEGIIRSGSLGDFNSVATIHAPSQKESLVETQRLARETVKLTEKTDSLLEQYKETPTKRQTAYFEPSRPPQVPIIHKREQSTFSEELLERLEQQRTAQTVSTTVSENVNKQEIHQIAQNQVNSQVITQTTEDITQLVNRTLAKQMNTISDRVYQQMEKRLQTERSRRGRF